MACPALGLVVPGLGPAAGRGRLALRSGIPSSWAALNQSGMASRRRGYVMSVACIKP